MAKICKIFKISGRVQGVWFRSAARKEALNLNITGWAKNIDNGDVEILACGEEVQLMQFEKWLWRGPILARVKNIISEEKKIDLCHDFNIL